MSVTSVMVGSTLAATIGVISISAAELRVQVTESRTSAPVKAVVVAVGAFPRVISGLTDATGSVVLQLPSLEKVAIAVRTDTHGIKCIGSERIQGSSVSVTMTPSIRVYGVVTDASGAAVADATVSTTYEVQPECRVRFDVGAPAARTNERGEYVVRNVDLERNALLTFQHPFLKGVTVDKSAFSESDRMQRRKELNVRLDNR